jgi:hypothetical protein
MKTDQLIDSLVADRQHKPLQPGRGMVYVLPTALLIAIALFAFILDMRPDLGSAMESWRYLLKLLLAALIATTAMLALLRLARPEQDARPVLRWLPFVVVPLVLGFVAEGSLVPVADWGKAALGESPLYCLTYVPLLSLAPLAAILWAMARGAPQSPAATGAVAGLAAGGLGAFIYAIHCDNDSPFYVAIWYLGAIGIVTVLGALVGQRYLRW